MQSTWLSNIEFVSEMTYLYCGTCISVLLCL